MQIHISSILSRMNLRILTLSVLCITGAFVFGIQTAGEVQPVTLIEAGSIEEAGDIDESGFVDLQDVIDILEIAQGYTTATPEQLRADPNGDGFLTVDDALSVLSELTLR